ncbi:BCHE [Branchiostoma lanceolatum]|uniref:BCHE protein n=1 Tax=Branchiostoma lanceolatum TaxID=7740 RepID=A0A8K0AJ20_BRALA|nr:BCHE [Branchiostoma lanceolatum]
MAVYILAALCAAVFSPVAVQAAAEVTAPAGRLVGLEQDVFGTTVHAFLGVPFAHPPVGERRFRRAERLPAWDGVYNATTYPNTCIQESSLTVLGGEITPKSEDCLYLNVWQPNPVPTGAAVMVWIHGGGFRIVGKQRFRNGGKPTALNFNAYGFSSRGDPPYMRQTSQRIRRSFSICSLPRRRRWVSTVLQIGDLSESSAQYTGKYLTTAEGVIVVTVNYRVGPLGFLYTGTDDAPGNMGLTDQLLALQWVQDNIPSFGGDSSKVTIFGNGAGAASVGFHLLSPESRNVFSRGILQSGGASILPGVVDTKSDATDKTAAFSESLGCPTEQGTAALLTCLRSQGAEQFATLTSFYPVKDNIFIPTNPLNAIDDGKFKRSDILIGTNTNEGVYLNFLLGIPGFSVGSDSPVDREQFLQAMNMPPQGFNELSLDAVEFQYTDWLHPDADTRYRDILDAARGDYSFVCPAVATAGAHARFGSTAYMYEFGYRVCSSPWPDWVVATHGDEIQFVFGLPTIPDAGYSTEDADVSRTLMRYWANFAKTGDPNNNNVTVWTPFTEADRTYMFLDGSGPRMMTGLKTTECAFWDVYVPSLMNKTGDFTHNSFCFATWCRSPEPVQCQTTSGAGLPSVWGQSLTLALLLTVFKDIISFVTSIFLL